MAERPSAVERVLPPGTGVGEYAIEAVIGEGGFGRVYRAIHPVIGKPAAVKVLNAELSSNPEMVERFLAEARAVNTIRHRNIVDIFNFGTLDDGRCYFVMELLDGASFAHVLATSGPPTPRHLCNILDGVVSALEAAHQKGIVHRDLKPENVFLHREGDTLVPKLVDFGIAKLLGDARGISGHRTRTGVPIGTPHYMSPEQCFNHSVDHLTDVYAFGILCFEGLTGQLPFDADSFLELMNMQTRAPRPRPSERRPELGVFFDEAVCRMMSIDKTMRPQSIREAFELLQRASALHDEHRSPSGAVPSTRAADHLRGESIAHGQTVSAPGARPDADAQPYGERATAVSPTVLSPAGDTLASGEHLAPNRGAHTLAAVSSEDEPTARASRRGVAAVLAATAIGVGVAGWYLTTSSDARPATHADTFVESLAIDVTELVEQAAEPPTAEPTAAVSAEPASSTPPTTTTPAPRRAVPRPPAPNARPRPPALPDPDKAFTHQ